MRTAIFCEGKRDLHLMRLFFYIYHEDREIDYMVGEEIESARLKKQESERLGHLFDDWNDKEVLIKSEEGKDHLVEVFTHLVRYVTDHEARAVFLVDLDGGDVGRIGDRIKEKVESRFRGQRLTVQRRGMHESNELTLAESSLVSDSGDEGRFYTIGFEHSMEISAGIDRENDDVCTQVGKMCRLLENDILRESLHRPICQGKLS